MYLQKDNNFNWLALLASFGALGIVIVILMIIKLITPIPPFPEMAQGGGMEVNYGIYNAGTGNVEQNSMGEATDVLVKEENAATTQKNNTEETYTSEQGENVETIKENKKHNEEKSNAVIIKPTEVKEKPREKTAAEILAEKFNKTKGQGGGDGNSGNAGNEGDPNGNPFTHGKGGTGNNPDGTGIGNSPGKGNAPFGFDLKGRSLLTHPALPADTKEEGIVVVDIVVDKNGNVTEATSSGRGTTTTSPVLKAKARQFALQLKFTANAQYEEQKGSITIIFSFK